MAIVDGSVLTAADLVGLAGAGGWTAFSPNWNFLTVGNGTVTAAYTRIGDTYHYRIGLTWGSTTSISGNFYPSLNVVTAAAVLSPAAAFVYDSSAAAWQTAIFLPTSYILTPTSGRFSATVPWTWATGDVLRINGTVEVA